MLGGWVGRAALLVGAAVVGDRASLGMQQGPLLIKALADRYGPGC
jgi:hypothetical protein